MASTRLETYRNNQKHQTTVNEANHVKPIEPTIHKPPRPLSPNNRASTVPYI